MRDHRRLRAFVLADQLVLTVYEVTREFPSDERFGLTNQMRRASVSVASNIVEGCGRHTQADYLHFLDMAFGSARELAYQITLAERLGFVAGAEAARLQDESEETCRVLAGLIQSLRAPMPPS